MCNFSCFFCDFLCLELQHFLVKSAIFSRLPKDFSVFDIRPFSSARKHIPRSHKKLLLFFIFNGFVFNNLTFRLLEVFG